MADKGFGVKEINLIGASGTPTIESPNNINLNAVNVAISTNVSIGGTLSVTGNISIGGTLTYEDVTNVDAVGIITARSGINIQGNSTFTGNVLDFGESKQLRFGANNDFTILHNGNTLLENDTAGGNLTINNKSTSGQLKLQVSDGDNALVATPEGYVHFGSTGHGTNKVGGQAITGQDFDPYVKILGNADNRWLMQARNDSSTGTNGIFVRAGNANSNYALYTCGTDETKAFLTVNGKGAVGIGTNVPGQSNLPGIHIRTESSDDCRIAFSTPTKASSRIGYYGLSNRFGMDVYNGFEIRDVAASYATRFKIDSSGQLQATGAADVRLTLGSSGTAGTNDSVHIRADSANLNFMAASGGITKFEVNGTETLSIDSSGRVTKPAHPTFCARYKSGSSFSSNILVLTKVDDDYLTWNNGGYYSTTTGKFTAPVAGFYYFEGQVMATGFSNGSNIQDMVQITSNNGLISHPRQRRTYFRTEDDANGYYTNSASGQAKLAAGDTVWFQRNGGGSWGMSNTAYTYFTGWLIG